MNTIVNPDSLAPPRGYSNGIIISGTRTLFIAGQIGWNRDCEIVSDDFAGQFAQALDNVLDVLREAGGSVDQIGRLTIYVTDRVKYLNELQMVGKVYRERMGKHYPAMALVEVAALLEPRALLEIEATAILP